MKSANVVDILQSTFGLDETTVSCPHAYPLTVNVVTKSDILYFYDIIGFIKPPQDFLRKQVFTTDQTHRDFADEVDWIMAHDAANSAGTGAKKDVTTAILERKKSPNRLVVGRAKATLPDL